MTDKELVLRKLAILREHASRAARRRPADLEAFKRDDDAQDALAMSLFVALQEAIDVAFHIDADEGWSTPASNAESFETLATHAVIDRELADKLVVTVRIRNRLAHGYATVDVERVWRELPDGLAQLESYAAAVTKWLAAQP